MKSRPTLFWLLFGMAYMPAAAMLFTCLICGISLMVYEKIVGTQMSRMVGTPYYYRKVGWGLPHRMN